MDRRPLHLDPDHLFAARELALGAGFRRVVRILNTVHNRAGLTSAEALHLCKFVVLLRLRAELHYPYWDADGPDHDPADADFFQDVNMGLYAKLAHDLCHAFPAEWDAAG